MRTIAVSVLLLVVLAIGATWPSMSPAQGTRLALPERRALATYQEKVFPSQLKAIEAAAGVKVAVEVDWNAVALPGQGRLYGSRGYWTDIYFVPVARALSEVTADEIGRLAVKEKLKRIVLTYNPDTAPTSSYRNGVSFDGSVLIVNFRPGTNADDIRARTDAIRRALEANL